MLAALLVHATESDLKTNYQLKLETNLEPSPLSTLAPGMGNLVRFSLIS